MLKNFSPRPYQLEIFNAALKQNTLVVLPTGLGKTAIAMMVAARRLLLYPKKKVLFLAPTKPLVEQQLKSFQKDMFLPKEEFVLFTGSTAPAKRHQMWTDARVVFSTPQTIENDVLSNKISLDDVSLLIIDEAHRATGDYAYVYLAKKYGELASHSRIMALTASPGADKEKIDEIVGNLLIEKIEYRKSDDKSVAKFTAGTKVTWDHVLLPDFLQNIVAYLKRAYQDRLTQVKEFGHVQKKVDSMTKSQLLKLQHELHAKAMAGEKTPELLQTISLCAQAIKISHALELAESQTLHSLHEYLFGILKKAKTAKTKAIKNLAMDPNILSALSIARDKLKEEKEHPKIAVLVQRTSQILKRKPTAKIIIFTQYRDTAFAIKKHLDCSSELFFGQSKKEGFGLSQKEQQRVLQEFRENKFSCLIATSVAEEGLDIPSVDQVFFYEPVPSAIRSVQRRGRTGRHEQGFVTVLVAKGTRDETFRWIAHHKEKRMYNVLSNFSTQTIAKTQRSLNDFKPQQSVKIIGDFREKGSAVLKSLDNLGVGLELKQLSVGDFVLSKECCVEYKEYGDFVDSIVDGRLLTQLRSLAQYSKPVVIIEGEERLNRRIDPHAVSGMLATIALSYRIPVLRTFSPLETAKLLLALAKAEQEESSGSFTFHTAKPLDDRQVLEYVLSSIPSLGTALAKSLLEKFDTLKAIFEATPEQLQEIPLIGKKKATEIKRVIALSYQETKKDGY